MMDDETVTPVEKPTDLPPIVWFIGPIHGPGYIMLFSVKSKHSDRYHGEGSWHKPPNFPWKSMDRDWSASHKPQGTTAMDYAEGWSVLSVADYTEDSRPNVMAIFAVGKSDMSEQDMMELAADRYPLIWSRLGVTITNAQNT